MLTPEQWCPRPVRAGLSCSLSPALARRLVVTLKTKRGDSCLMASDPDNHPAIGEGKLMEQPVGGQEMSLSPLLQSQGQAEGLRG